MYRNSTSAICRIAAGGTQSTEIRIADYAFAMLKMPAAAVGTVFTLEGRLFEEDEFEAILDSDDTPLSINFTASKKIRIPDAAFGCFSIRLVSDASETAGLSLPVRLTA